MKNPFVVTFFISIFMISCASTEPSVSKKKDLAISDDPSIQVQPAELETYLTLQDMGSGFIQIPPEEFGVEESTFGEDVEVKSIEIFMNPNDFQLFMNIVFSIEDPMTRAGFSLFSQSPDLLATAFTSGMGDDVHITMQRELTGIDGLGRGMEFFVDIDGIKFIVQVVIITSGDVRGALVMNMHMKKSTGSNIDLHQVLEVLNSRL